MSARPPVARTKASVNPTDVPQSRKRGASSCAPAAARAAAELAALANLGPKSAQALVASGITSFAQLRRLGSVAAYARVKQHEPKVTLNLLWALEGALGAEPWQVVAKEHRTSLLLALEQYQRGG